MVSEPKIPVRIIWAFTGSQSTYFYIKIILRHIFQKYGSSLLQTYTLNDCKYQINITGVSIKFRTFEGYQSKQNARAKPFHVIGLFLYPLKTENLWFPNVFREYREKPVAWNGFKINNFFVVTLWENWLVYESNEWSHYHSNDLK